MRRLAIGFILQLFVITNMSAQYYYSRHVALPTRSIKAPVMEMQYPINREDVKAIGMGNAQMAGGHTFNAMMYNPALLGKTQNRIECFGLYAGMPGETFDAVSYLSNHMDEFTEAISLNQVWDGVNAFFETGATNEERLAALQDVQDGMQFTIDLFSEVTGTYDDPKKHGIGLLPAISVQWGRLGFSLYGFGYSGLLVQQSPTLEALLDVEIPSNLDNPIRTAKAIAEVMGILGTVVIDGGQTFSDEVFPVAFYVSYFDIVGAVGYAYPVLKDLNIGANLKVVNRRFSTDRIPVIDYDTILQDAWDNLKASVTGVTFDLGAHYRSPIGTELGLSVQNVLPVKEIQRSIDLNFSFPQITYDRDENGQVITNAQGDTALVSTYRKVQLNRPIALMLPLIASIGISHPITSNWDVALDWVDIFEKDTRYEKTFDRLRIGMEYRYGIWGEKLTVTPRIGMADQHVTLGLGLNLFNIAQIDGAYAYDRFVRDFSYFAQVKFGW